ncbi:MAG: hypothetical protein SOH60_11275 [Lachnospiraceae bacterium]|jgi:hypothetical protein
MSLQKPASGSLWRQSLSSSTELLAPYSVLDPEIYDGKTTSQIMEEAIDEALDYDFGAVLDLAVELRHSYNMRLNPQVIMVRAAMHPKRAAFSEQNPGVFAKANAAVMARADEPASQLAYYLFRNGTKNSLPNPLKKTWRTKLESLTPYQVSKYRNTGLGIIDVTRISHASSPVLDELMRTGTVGVEENEQTWEKMRSSGKSWSEILSTISLGHMALLRNLRNIFAEIDDGETCDRLMTQLKDGVLSGKQFPFRYYSAWNAVKAEDPDRIHFQQKILDTLEECVDISIANMPHLSGKTVCLSDNSGSAWYTIPSEYGTVTIAEIDNLSSVIAAMGSDEGYVGLFGDRLIMIPVSNRNGALSQAMEMSRRGQDEAGFATESGIWVFFAQAIRRKEHWDNIFIYSDQQAGHGRLCCDFEDQEDYLKEYGEQSFYVDVAKLAETYRRTVNPKVNIFSVQTAGYNNVLIPEYTYRGNCLYGWTGKELVFADRMIRFWDEQDSRHQKKG